jgi:hypothetical protein
VLQLLQQRCQTLGHRSEGLQAAGQTLAIAGQDPVSQCLIDLHRRALLLRGVPSVLLRSRTSVGVTATAGAGTFIIPVMTSDIFRV